MIDINRPATLAEIADVIGKLKSTIERQAKKEDWKFTEEQTKGRHNKRLFALTDLPKDIRAKISSHRLNATLRLDDTTRDLAIAQTQPVAIAEKSSRAVAVQPAPAVLDDKQRLRDGSRQLILQFVRTFKGSLEKAVAELNTGYADGIQRAARFYYLQKMAFGGKVANQSFGTATTSAPRLNLLRVEEELSAAHLRLSRVFIEHLSWEECIRRYDRPHTLFYLDPPYWGTEGYGVVFGFEQYALMADLARTIKGKMIISVNDIPEMREAFNGLKMDSVDINYTVGGANRSKAVKELVIRNW